MEKIRQNIFGIGEVYELQKEGQWVEKSRESYREYGYFGGGNQQSGPHSTIVSRIDFSNDTVTANRRGNLSVQSRGSRATGNSNFGYFGGGYIVSTVRRIDYSNDSATGTIRGSLSLAAEYQAASGNLNFGYFGGGGVGGGAFDTFVRSIVSRIDYSNDTNTALGRGNLVKARAVAGSVASSSFSYFAGGTNYAGNWNVCCPAAAQTNIDRLSFSNDTANCLLRNNFTTNGRILPGAAGNASYAWFTGGFQFNSSLSSVDRLDYSNDTQTLSSRGPLTRSGYTPASTGNSNFGYFGGGGFLSVGTLIDRVDYSNDTVITSRRGNIVYDASAATSSASFGGSPVSYLGAPWVATAPYGYFGGGVNPSSADISTVDRIDYTNDTNTAIVRTFLQSTIYEPTGVSNNNFGYFGGGVATPGVVSRVDRIDYANDTASTSNRGALSIARETRATGNQNFGYFGGGRNTSVLTSTVDRISYSNDTVTALTRSILSAARYRHTATGNSNFGYFMGGRTPSPPPYFSTVDRLDYSSDTTNASIRGPLSYNTCNFGSTGNNNFGYIAGGSPNFSIVNRIDYANDTSTASVRGLLAVSRELVATGNSNFGYFGLGFNGVVNFSDLYRVDYSNDTQIASVRGNASQSKRQLAASSSQAYGGAPNTTTDPIPTYIRANTVWDDSNALDVPYKRVLGSYGYFGGNTSTVDRVEYSNDTAVASVRGPLTLARTALGGVGNINYGYFAGGFLFSPLTFYSTVDRVDYSNDSSIASVRGSLSANGYREGGFSTNDYGWLIDSTGRTRIERITYSNDSVTAVSRGPGTTNRYYIGATGNNNFGYFGGGLGPLSSIDRVNYSNDTTKASVRGPLSLERYALAATGNSDFGYFGGGVLNPSTSFSTVDRIDYSNDTQTASVRGPLSLARIFLTATGNSNFGYFGGGAPGPRTLIDRINYSNDTVTASVRGALSLAKQRLAATTNARSS